MGTCVWRCGQEEIAHRRASRPSKLFELLQRGRVLTALPLLKLRELVVEFVRAKARPLCSPGVERRCNVNSDSHHAPFWALFWVRVRAGWSILDRSQPSSSALEPIGAT